MLIQKLKKIGKLEEFEIKNASITSLVLSPSIVLYSLLIIQLNPNVLEIPWGKEITGTLFLVVGLLPYTKNKTILNNYGWYVFGVLSLFSHYLIYITYLNNFSLDYLLGTYIAVFGSILLLKDKFYIILFNASCLINLFFRVYTTEFVDYEGYAILTSMGTIFIFSFVILNDSIRYKKRLIKNNLKLEEKVMLRTKDLEKRRDILVKKNEELEEYAYVISHDLKSPIRNIHTITQWLIEDNQEVFNEEINANLNLIKEQSNQMELLVNGILDYSLNGREGMKKERINLDKMLVNLAKSNSSATCKILLKNAFPKIEGVKFQVLQVFQNLIQNAVKYCDKEEIVIQVDYISKNNFYQFSIEDNGMGIEEKYFEKIFRLFQKLDSNDKSNSIGLGLSLVKKIINTMGGEIWLTSKVDKGTTFYFTIPK